MNPIVIIGSGLAGYTVARELRKLDKHVPLALIAAENADFYSKPMLSNAFGQGKTAAELVTTPARRMAEQLGLTLHARTQVQAIDRGRCQVRTDQGDFQYERLVCALGADPVRLGLGGDAASEVLSVNDLSDYARLRSVLDPGDHVAIIGAGLIGCEFANDLAAAGYRVSVIDPAGFPLANLAPESAGGKLVAPLAALGVDWHFGTGVTAVDRIGRRLSLTLSSAQTLEADAVLSAVGLRPRTALAGQAGLTIRRGIVTDRLLRSLDPSIFAIGDCAEIAGEVRPYVLPIMHAARALASTLVGKERPVEFPPMPVSVKTPACPIVVQPAPLGVPGQWHAERAGEDVRMLFRDADGVLRGFVLAGRCVSERTRMTQMLLDPVTA